MPCPRPINRQFFRCSKVASARRGNHASGTASSRPSANTTTIRSSITATSTAVASNLTAEVGMPSLHKIHAVLDHQQTEPVQLVRAEPARFGNGNRLKPKLRDVVPVFYMDMWRLRSFHAVEEEPKSGYPQDGRHQHPFQVKYDARDLPSTAFAPMPAMAGDGVRTVIGCCPRFRSIWNDETSHTAMSRTCFALAAHAPIRKARSVPVET